jgi:hypothetical protein
MGRVNAQTRGMIQDRSGRDSDKDGTDISPRPEHIVEQRPALQVAL